MKKTLFMPILFAVFAIIAVVTPMVSVSAASAADSQAAPAINATGAILTDASGDLVLFEQNADTRRPIASMVKIMSLCIVFDEIDEGRLTVSEMITASENASSMGGSQAFLDARASYNAGELIKSVIVASANDSCVALAERISFSVDNFVARMNERASEMGLENTNFVNCTGLPAPNQYSTARDVAKMFARLIKNPLFFEYSGVWMYDFQHPSGRATSMTNTNKLVRFYEGCDGGKTGYTSEAKSCLASTATRNGSRFISVVMGAESSKLRNAEVCKLFDYGFANWESRQLIFKNIPLETRLSVPNSKQKSIAVAPDDDYLCLKKRGEEMPLTVNTEFFAVKAPVNAGDVVGKLTVMSQAGELARVNIVAAESASEIGISDIIGEHIIKW